MLRIGTYVKKDKKTLYHFCKQVQKEKIDAKLISSSTINRNKDTFKKLQNANFYEKSIQRTTKEDIDSFINSYTYLSQSELDKLVNFVRAGYEKAMKEDLISYKKNFMLDYRIPFSEKQEKEVVAFELEEFLTLLKYILIHDNLIINSKCRYDSRTIRNLIILSFLSLTRIGELGAIDLDKHINLDKKYIVIERTLTDDENGKVIMGTTTKTGKRQKKTQRRKINFNIFSEDLYEMVLKDQIEHARANKNNKNNLLFCDKNGNFITASSVTSIFKRICRTVGVKLNLETGCFIHMTRHTGISFMICMGFDLIFITIFSGHSSIREIEQTYGHILDDYKKQKLENPNFQYTKEDIITAEVLKLVKKIYKK